MSDLAIKVEGLSKRYRIGAQQRAYRTLREKLNETAMAPFRAMKALTNGNGNGHKSRSETFWALKDVSFEIKPGEAVGIIGRNGAGKSTLLKILSRITEPTEGYADIHGRIASLLEVGTGFHPELSGRENIFLNGSILGMKRVEIRKKFDEMVAFAEIEKFIDTPVKHYSSGMYVRLAFAVAAHLDPEILLIDEVLAVGDAEFQKKCLGKMGDVAREGRTVLFVSHNMAAVRRLCQSGMYLEGGRVKFEGDAESAVDVYYLNNEKTSNSERIEVLPGEAKYTSWELVNSSTGALHSCYSRDSCEFRLHLSLRRPVANARLGFALQDLNDQNLITAHSLDNGGAEIDLCQGDYEVSWTVRLPIKEGTYKIVAGLGTQVDGQTDLWTGTPWLTVLPREDSHLTGGGRGLVSEDVSMEIKQSVPRLI